MEREPLEFTIVIGDGADTTVLGRLADIEMANAAFTAAVARHSERNVALRHGARIVRRHDGEPRPEPSRDPDLRSWSAHLIGGRKLQLLGVIEAASEPAAIEAAVALFGLDDRQRRRLAVSQRP